MADTQTTPPLPQLNLGPRTAVGTDGVNFTYWVLDRITRAQGNLPSKMVVLERIKHENEDIQLRIVYYMYHSNGKKGRWNFRQDGPMAYADDLDWLIAEARKKNWLK
jgi:hypothetical protein